MKSQPVLIFIAILTLLAVISLPLTHASTRAERKKRAGRKLRRTKDSAARPPRGARWKGYKLLAEKSGIVQWHVENNSKVFKIDAGKEESQTDY